ncbi:MAG: hypothetical protein ACE15F_13495 [bacterium]
MMITVKTGILPEDVKQSAKHVIFVEGKDDNSFDRLVLRTLFQDRIDVKPLGPSYHIRSAAEAFYKHHPTYYFLIDRDHYDDHFVEACWRNFPDPQTHNLLVWRRRELENYFIIPEYLSNSSYLRVSQDCLCQVIRDEAQKRLYMDAANQVILFVREKLKENWIQLFSHLDQFLTKEAALEQLRMRKEFDIYKSKAVCLVDEQNIAIRFEEILSRLTGDVSLLTYGQGTWLEEISGKEIFHAVANRCLEVKDQNGNILRGRIQLNEIVKDLLKKPLDVQPPDFQQLHEMIIKRIRTS